MKSPFSQRPDDQAREATEEFIAAHARTAHRGREGQGGGREGRVQSQVGGRASRPGRTGRAVSSRRCRGPSRSHTSRRVPGRTRSGRSTARSEAPPRPSPRAGTGSSSWPPRGGTRPSARRARRCAPIRCRSCPSRAAAPRVLAVGEVLPEIAATRRAPSLPVDVARTIESMHEVVPLDVCHVHEPFAPSTSSAALRHSRALNVGTFHIPPTERIVSTQLARRVVELVFGRLDARLASYEATARAPRAGLPRRVPHRARPAWRSPAAHPRPATRACTSSWPTRRSAVRCASRCARCAASTRRCRGGSRS